MIEAKDTVTNATLIQVWVLEFIQPGDLALNAKLKEFAQAQAEISFKAGYKDAIEQIDEAQKKIGKRFWESLTWEQIKEKAK